MKPKEENVSIDLVIPVYNEAGVVEQTHASLRAVIDILPYSFSIYYVDDGSTDETVPSLESLDDRQVPRDLGHRARAAPQHLQYGSPRRIGHRRQDSIVSHHLP